MFVYCRGGNCVSRAKGLLVKASGGDDKFADYKPETAFFFPGQGAQSVGMGQVWGHLQGSMGIA